MDERPSWIYRIQRDRVSQSSSVPSGLLTGVAAADAGIGTGRTADGEMMHERKSVTYGQFNININTACGPARL